MPVAEVTWLVKNWKAIAATIGGLLLGVVLVASGWYLCSLTTKAEVEGLRTKVAELETAAAIKRADRATAYAADSDQTATREHQHASDTVQAADQFTAGAGAREAALRSNLADARRLLDRANARAAGYRAKAEADAASCRSLADRAAALDRSLAEGRLVAAELRGIVERRDAEVALLADLLDADDRMLEPWDPS